MTRRLFALLVAALPVLAGCGHIYHVPCEDGPPWRPADTVPEENKACVYVFLFDSFDPFAVGGLAPVQDHLRKLGFGKTYYGWPHHLSDFELELATVSAERPMARFAIIGFGSGAKAARKLADFANAIGAPVDVAIYLEPSGVDPVEDPGPALSTFTIRAMDLEPSDGTFVARHFHKSDVPTHPETLKIIEREVTLLGLEIPPPPRPPAPAVFLVAPMPAPRDVIPIPKELPPEWQFLRPRPPWLAPAPPEPFGVESLPLPRRLPELPPPTPKP